MEMAEENIRYVYRPVPCPAYDVEGTESWLSDLAAEGLVLSSDGFFLGFGIFVRGEPTQIRYRLEAAERGTDLLGSGDAPQDEAIELSESLGWRYVTRRGDFYVYASDSPNVRELNTDPAVQALALEQVVRRLRVSVLSLIFELLFFCFLLPLLRGGGQILIAAIQIGTWFWLWGRLLILWYLVDGFLRTRHLNGLHKRLLQEGSVDHAKNWRRSALRHYLLRVLRTISVIAWIITLLCLMNSALLGKRETPIAAYTEDPPFPTLVDLADSEVIEYRAVFPDIANTVSTWTDWLSPVNYRWEEIAEVRFADGTVIEGGYDADYHEMRTDWLAEALAREYHRVERWDFDGDYARMEVALPDVDYAVAFYDGIRIPTVVLRKGKKVVRISFNQHGEDSVSIEEFAALAAEYLK